MIETKLIKFHTGTNGMKDHEEFLRTVDNDKVKIINSFILYHEYSSSHKPESINYVIQYYDDNMKLTKQNYTKEFIIQRIADQREYIAKLEQKPNRHEVWESAKDTLIMWVLKLKDYEQRNNTTN